MRYNIIIFLKKNLTITKKISLEDRFGEEEIHGKHEIFISMSVDATEVPIQRPPEDIQQEFYSGKSKCHSLKYEVAVRVAQPFKIVWVSGPWPGAMHDINIIRHSGLLSKLSKNERLIADLGYQGEPAIITAFKGTNDDLEIYFNSMLSKKRVISENVYSRFKSFSILTDRWRCGITKQVLERHRMIFVVIAKIISLDALLHPFYKQ